MALLGGETISSGFGPCNDDHSNSIHPQIPFSVFTKDKLVKAADWGSRGYSRTQGTPKTVFNNLESQDREYMVVDKYEKKRGRGHKQSYRRSNQNYRDQKNRGIQHKKRGRPQKKGKSKKSWYQKRWNLNQKPYVVFPPSVEVQPNWGEPVESIEFPSFKDVRIVNIPDSEDVYNCGNLLRFDKSYDNLSTRNPKLVDRNWAQEKRFYNVSTSIDPVINQFSQQEGFANVYGTSKILSALMSTLKSIYSFDIIVSVEDGNIYFDTRDDYKHLETVNENAHVPPREDEDPSYNATKSLHEEATFLSKNFSQQVLSTSQQALMHTEASPFKSTGDAKPQAEVAYSYKKWEIDDKITIFARTELNACKSKQGSLVPILVRALTEYDPKVTGGWRKNLENLRNGVLATEFMNNSNKMAQWAIQSHLSGAGGVKIGFIARNNPKDPYNHVILGTQYFKTEDLISDLNLDLSSCWGTLIYLINRIKQLDNGRYMLFRDPAKKVLHLYHLPLDEYKIGHRV
eukprot:TRINITY_DN12338_c0_g1_i1.p1 TRINITY_DN12338_c0_g1~~TRINITY_DN12338_c0_g1_i1.p1  ORF type:complete len:514 (-),score=117.92 TRINITY_DN12338_c0_g1_i1:41-1582(-)